MHNGTGDGEPALWCPFLGVGWTDDVQRVISMVGITSGH